MSWTVGRRVATALVLGAVLCPQVAATAAPKPPSVAQLRKEFLADSAKLDVAVLTWINKGQTLPNHPTWTELSEIDQPFASALTKFDSELQRFRATGTVEVAITQLVEADHRYIVDLTAPTGQKLFTAGIGRWEAAIGKDGTAVKKGQTAVRGALGLPTPT
jgi:hypothetical protein